MKDVIKEFDLYLDSKNLEFNAIVIGGAALNIMDVTTRVTKDVDLIDPEIPEEIKKASVEFITAHPEFNLDKDWLNNGPISIIRDLPTDWRLRAVEIFKGKSIILSTLGRSDLLKTKLYALCDRGIDLADCIQLKPTLDEINEALPWVLKGDASELWPDRVNEMINALKEKLGY